MTARRARGSAGQWIRIVGPVGVALAFIALQTYPAVADIRVSIDACRSIKRLVVPQGTDLVASQCSQRFSPRDPYVAIVTRVRDVAQIPRVDVLAQIYDPEQTLVESYRWGRDVEPSGGFEIWDVAVLPLAGSSTDLATQLPDFQEDIIQLKGGRPFRDRPGMWTVRVTVNRQTYSLTFVLEN